jgi:hypothetical protein
MPELAQQFRDLDPKDQVEITLIQLGRLLQDGRTSEAGALAKELGLKASVIEAWCLYREKKFADCAEVLSRTPENQSTLELQAYLYAYEFTGLKDERKLAEVTAKLEASNVNANNAVVIAARENNSALDAAGIFNRLTPWAEGLDRSMATVTEANLLHNMARLALAKERFEMALTFIDYAIEAYGSRTNFHHRGAANYWRSVILEKMDRPYDAWQAGLASLKAWQDQQAQEPTNPEWQKRLEGAQKREQELHSRL